MNALEQSLLRRYCDKYGIDYYEIDSTLTYWENKEHLRTLMRMLSQTLDTFELARMEELQKQFIAEHFLEYYVGCQIDGKTKSAEVGKPIEVQQFSLRTHAQRLINP